MICPNCNMTLHEDERVCPNCGAEVDIEKTKDEQKQKTQGRNQNKNNNTNGPKVVIILLVLVAIIIVVIAFIVVKTSCVSNSDKNNITISQQMEATLVPSNTEAVSSSTKATIPSSTASAKTEVPSEKYVNEEYGYTLIFPGDYVKHCKVVNQTKDTTKFCLAEQYDDDSEYDGTLFSIVVSDSDDISGITKAKVLGQKEIDGQIKYFISIEGTGIRCNPDNTEFVNLYNQLKKQLTTVLDSFTI